MGPKQRNLLIGLIVILIVGFIAVRSVLYTVNERELAVVLQFGDPVASRTEPGLYFKLPFVQEVKRLPKTLQFWNGANEPLVDLPSADGKKIEVTPWAVWRITEPRQFVQVLRTVDNAESRVQQFVRSSVRDVITAHDLEELVRSTDRELSYSFQQQEEDSFDEEVAPQSRELKTKIKLGREKLVQLVKRDVVQRLAEEGDGGRGIELVDVGVSRIDFVDQVRAAAFDRLIAFMESIAARYLNEGQRRKQEIINRTQAEVQKIEGEGTQESNRIKGEVDAEIIDMYAKAINETGDFYNFIRTLEAYESALKNNSRLILTTDSEFFKLLKKTTRSATVAAPPSPSHELPDKAADAATEEGEEAATPSP